MLRIRDSKLGDIAGFAAETVAPGAALKILTRGTVTSDDPLFYVALKQISNLFLSPNNIPINYVSNFLIVMHPDATVDIYINNEPVVFLEVAVRRAIAAGENVMWSDIADIRRLTCQGVTLATDDKVIHCLKVGWKFGLFFDLARPSKLDPDDVALSVGELYRYLNFEQVYRTLQTEVVAKAMFAAGWFPFSEIVTAGYDLLAAAYAENVEVANRVQAVVNSFDRARIERMTQRWWESPVFKEKQPVIQAGLDAFLQDAPSGFITCIKTIGTEIEGILRSQYVEDKGKAVRPAKILIQHIVDRGKQKAGAEGSLLLPDYFLTYLKDKVFAAFDPASVSTKVAISVARHSVSHGAASPASYTKQDALQMILVLDQIHFFSK